MIEAGVVISKKGEAMYWHLPPGRSISFIPDTRVLWDILWKHRDELAGFAHSHPGGGIPCPSEIDLTTFLAIEQALGQRLQWWITSSDALIQCKLLDRGPITYCQRVLTSEPSWADELRRMSSNL